MKLQSEKLSLKLTAPFKIAHGTSTVRENILLHITDGKYTGVGEAAVVPYYGETPERVIGYFDSLKLDTLWLEHTLASLPPTASSAAKTAVDIALHDLWGKQLGQPLYKLWGLNPAEAPVTSFTIGMEDDEATYRNKVQQASHFPQLKIKLGSGDLAQDLNLVKIVRAELPDHEVCVDANSAWSPEQGLDIIPKLAELGVIFVEQPVGKLDFEGWRKLKQDLPSDMPPLIADESVQGVESVARLIGLVDGINIKLAKCGGLRPARQMITLARANDMRVMIGCMVESSVAITAAAHLSPLVDYADLDGNLQLSNDPYRGAYGENGKIIIPDAPGLGVVRHAE